MIKFNQELPAKILLLPLPLNALSPHSFLELERRRKDTEDQRDVIEMKRESSVASGCVFVFMKEENCPFLPFVASLPQSSAGFELLRYENNEVK